MSKRDWYGPTLDDIGHAWVMAWGYGIFVLLALAVTYGLVAWVWATVTG